MRYTMTWTVLGLLVAVTAGCGSKDHEHGKSTRHDEPQDAHASGSTVADTVVKGKARDPVCGMITQAGGHPEFVYRDTRFHFCSEKCLKR